MGYLFPIIIWGGDSVLGKYAVGGCDVIEPRLSYCLERRHVIKLVLVLACCSRG